VNRPDPEASTASPIAGSSTVAACTKHQRQRDYEFARHTFQTEFHCSRFLRAQYNVSANLVARKSKVTVRFQAAGNGRIAPVFGVRTIRSEMLR
jgi:hypothetical protein